MVHSLNQCVSYSSFNQHSKLEFSINSIIYQQRMKWSPLQYISCCLICFFSSTPFQFPPLREWDYFVGPLKLGRSAILILKQVLAMMNYGNDMFYRFETLTLFLHQNQFFSLQNEIVVSQVRDFSDPKLNWPIRMANSVKQPIEMECS